MNPRKSPQELKLAGTYNRHSSRKNWNDRNDRPLTAKPAPGRYLKRTQISWNKFMDMKASQGCLSVEDEDLIIRMFDSLDRYYRLGDVIDEHLRSCDITALYEDEEKRKAHREMERSMKEHGETFDRIAWHFGLSPTERSKLVLAPQKPQTEFMRILERAKA